MLVRKAVAQDLDAIYLMGYDVWGDGLTQNEYLLECQSSSKYNLGKWYVLLVQDKPVASLIVYIGEFGLAKNCYGIGSIATMPDARNKSFASFITKFVTQELLAQDNTEVIFLHSDINPEFYEKLGYQRIQQSNCMYQVKSQNKFEGLIPSYF